MRSVVGEVGVVVIDPVVSDTAVSQEDVVKRRLDVHKASFLSMVLAVEATGMEYGGITPIGLPPEWPVLVDRRVVEQDVVIIGSGVWRSKILLPGALFGRLPGVEIIDGLANPLRTQ